MPAKRVAFLCCFYHFVSPDLYLNISLPPPMESIYLPFLFPDFTLKASLFLGGALLVDDGKRGVWYESREKWSSQDEVLISHEFRPGEASDFWWFHTSLFLPS